MKQTRSQWAIITLFFIFSPSLSAQNHWTPMQKEWFSRIFQLLIAAKKTHIPTVSTVKTCVVSNEITITVAPCGDNLQKKEVGQIKPIQ
ncbi:MAG: hypothetical protein U5L45_06940 [Saprospiraceae bacterium]|nr:hypothetical protein [Saprospiraceae bacterium]